MIPVVHEQEKAAKCVAANTTPRSRKLSLLRAYVRGDQYDGRKKWYDKSVPVWEREPCVIWMAASGAITSNEDLLLGEGRYPAVTSRPEEDDGDEDEMLDKESSKVLDRQIRHIENEADLRAHEREQYCNGQSVGTVVGVFGAHKGKLFADVVDAEFCTAKLDLDGTVLELEIKYPYVDIYKDEQGQWYARAMFFRRVIDAARDVTFLPGKADESGIEPLWKEDPAQTVAHGLGFCPVVYHKFRRVSTLVNETDGFAIHARVLDELDAFNVEASIRHDGAVYSLPQKWETGVEPGFNPTGTTGPREIPATHSGGRVDAINNPQTAHYSVPTQSHQMPMGARVQGPGHVWQYPNPETKVGQLEQDAGALESLANSMADLRARICEALAWVPLNPEEIKFAAALSGKALERLMARQLNRVGKDRDGFGKGYLVPSYCMLLRIAAKLGTSLKTRGIEKSLKVIQSFGDLSGDWNDPPLSLQWGSWFAPIPEDDKALVETTTAAYTAKLITKESAIKKLARTFNIEDVTGYMESLEKENREREEKEAEELNNAVAKAQADAHAATRDRTGRSNPAANAGGGSGGAAAAPKGTSQGGSKPGIAKPKS